MEQYALIYLFFINIIGFIAMNFDKRRAIKGKWRIKENTLLFIALIGGSIGLYLGMKIFRHKTKHALFKYGVPLIIMLQIALLAFVDKGFNAK